MLMVFYCQFMKRYERGIEIEIEVRDRKSIIYRSDTAPESFWFDPGYGHCLLFR